MIGWLGDASSGPSVSGRLRQRSFLPRPGRCRRAIAREQRSSGGRPVRARKSGIPGCHEASRGQDDHPILRPRGRDAPWKDAQTHGADLIVANGFHIGVVFQHNNNRFGSFSVTRGRQDAERSLALAAENLQPKGSAIYFGVDGGWGKAEEIASIKAYFSAARERFRGSGYRIGVYGSGLVCRELLHDGLAELCWLANAKSWPGYNDNYRRGQWRLVQLLPVDCGGRNVDFNLSNGEDVDYGQFPPVPVRGRRPPP